MWTSKNQTIRIQLYTVNALQSCNVLNGLVNNGASQLSYNLTNLNLVLYYSLLDPMRIETILRSSVRLPIESYAKQTEAVCGQVINFNM